MEETQPSTNVIIYICPNAAICGNYYAGPDFRPDRSGITEPQSRRSETGHTSSFARLECPSCRARGVLIDRVPYIVTGVTPLEEALEESGVPPGIVNGLMGRDMAPVA